MRDKRNPAPAYGEPERAAWTMVLDAIEDAMDVDDLSAFDRGRLAEFHDKAGWYIGQRSSATSLRELDRDRDARQERNDAYWTARSDLDEAEIARFKSPGGLVELRLDLMTARPLRRAGLSRVEDVIRADQADELEGLHGLGPKRLARIREAIAAWTARQSIGEAR